MADTIFQIVRKQIFWILILALTLRLWGITYGLPLFLINDEVAHVYGAMKMIEMKTLLPVLHQEEFSKILYYPPLTSYILLPVVLSATGLHWLFSGMPGLEEYKTILALDPSFVWFAARAFTAVLGAAEVLIVYFIGRRMFQRESAGLFAAAFAALSFYHIQLSHNVRHWIFASFFLTATWFFSLSFFEKSGLLKRYAFLGVFVGAAAGGVNTAAAIGVVPVFLAEIFRTASGTFKPRLKALAVFFVSFALFALIFVTLYPYGLTRAEGASGPTEDVYGRLVFLSQKSVAGLFDFWGLYVKALWNFETPLLLIGLLGIGLLLWKGWRFWPAAFIAYCLSFFTILYLFDDYTVRGIVFITPMLSVFAGYAADSIWKQLSYCEVIKPAAVSHKVLNYAACVAFFALFFGWQAVTDARYVWLLGKDDTRLAAIQWIRRNIPDGSRILMDSLSMRLLNTADGIRGLEKIDSAALRAADRALLSIPADAYPGPAYQLLNLHFISREKRAGLDFNLLDPRGFEYLVVEYDTAGNIAEDVGRIRSKADLVARFSPWRIMRDRGFDGSGKLPRLSVGELFQMERFGLFVDIYRLQ